MLETFGSPVSTNLPSSPPILREHQDQSSQHLSLPAPLRAPFERPVPRPTSIRQPIAPWADHNITAKVHNHRHQSGITHALEVVLPRVLAEHPDTAMPISPTPGEHGEGAVQGERGSNGEVQQSRMAAKDGYGAGHCHGEYRCTLMRGPPTD